MKKDKMGILIPTYIEPNGKMTNFMKVVNNPQVQQEYNKLLKELKTDPKSLSKKLREVVWKDKTLR